MMYLIVSVVSFLVAGLTFFSGFGLGTLLMPVFAVFFTVQIAVAATAIVHLANNIFKVVLIGKKADKRTVLLFGLPAALAAIAGALLLGYLSGNVDYLRSFLEKELPQIRLVEPEATYLLWLDMSALEMTDDELKQFMIEKAGIGCNDGPGFGTGGSGFQRINVACPRSVLKQALNQLKEAVDQL